MTGTVGLSFGIEPMPQFELLIKPAACDCNLRCDYCFYLPKKVLFGAGSHRMTEELLELLVKRYFSIPMETYVFNWQGGEPTLMGVDFYRRALQLQQRFRPRGSDVCNLLQTNGTLLDTKWCTFLKRNKFIVGVSLDGPPELHDLHRRDASGRGTGKSVLKAIRLLGDADVPFTTLTLVTADHAGRGGEVYDFLRGLGVTSQHYIECVEQGAGGAAPVYSLRPGQWSEFMLGVLRRWLECGDAGNVSVRLFDTILSMLKGGQPMMCSHACNCRQYLVVEHNGDVFPCDFFVKASHRLGNIRDNALSELLDCEAYCVFGERKRAGQGSRCASCRFWLLCSGDCQKNRSPDGTSLLCDDWQRFYSIAIPCFERLIAMTEMR